MLDDDTVSRSAHRYRFDIPKVNIELDEHAQFHVRPIEAHVDDSTAHLSISIHGVLVLIFLWNHLQDIEGLKWSFFQ